MTCYEHLRKKPTDTYNRLKNYFDALENNQLEQYHKRHGRKWFK